MATLDQLRSGLKTRLATITGLRPTATYMEDVNPPAAMVLPVSAEFDVDMSADDTYQFDICVFVNGADLNRAQTAIDAYLSRSGANSIKVAIEADPTLGGVADSVKVRGFREYAMKQDVGGRPVLEAKVQVEVYA